MRHNSVDTKKHSNEHLKQRKSMKKMVMTLVALLTMTAAVAQDVNKNERKAPQPPTVEQMVEGMAKELNLTDEQKTKLIELNKDYEQKLKKILNEDQYKKYQMRNMRRGFRGGARPNGPQFGRRPEGQFQGPRMEAPKAE